MTFEELLSLLQPSSEPLFNRLFVLSAVRFRQWCNAKVPNWEKYSTTVGATGGLIGCISGEEGLVEFSCLVSLLAWGLISVSVGDTLAVVACTLQVITASLGERFPLCIFSSCQLSFFPFLSSFPLLPLVFILFFTLAVCFFVLIRKLNYILTHIMDVV